MVWNAPITQPVEGDYRVITKFAWTPKRIGDKKIWLQKYQQLWEFKKVRRHIISGRLIGPLIDCYAWVLISEKILYEKNTTTPFTTGEAYYH